MCYKNPIQSNLYDYSIVGSGVAGNVCSYLLQRKGFSSIILEKESRRKEKICGGGIPRKALIILKQIGMNMDELYSKDIAFITGDCVFWGSEKELNVYDRNEFSIGSSRKIFDDFLLSQALDAGAKIAWGENVKKITENESIFHINQYSSHNAILAVGAKGLDGRYREGQSIGISMQIYGETSLNNNIFYFFYYDKNCNRYFWIFPIGKKKWNIGLWSRYAMPGMREVFNYCWNEYVTPYFYKFDIISYPRGEFCGHLDLREKFHTNGIGDYAGCCNIKNGGGIYRAIKSAVHYVENCDKKRNAST